MKKIPVCAVFDVGKSNKKCFLLDENYQVLWEKSAQLPETTDEDGEPCEDIDLLQKWLFLTLEAMKCEDCFEIKALNFTTYGASLVHLNANGEVVAPLYNYLKQYPALLQTQFYERYGGESAFALQTASPVLGSLNSGMVLYRLKHEKPALFAQIKTSLHLPQFVGFLFTKQLCSDITSIGCHTNLWNFQTNRYHRWVNETEIGSRLAPIRPTETVFDAPTVLPGCRIGVGLHDSSAALVPYIASFSAPFVLISTGTWCISMNPFNDQPLTAQELTQDCLCFLTYAGKPVKAARLFAGRRHEDEINRLAMTYQKPADYYKTIHFEAQRLNAQTDDYEAAYYRLMGQIVSQQVASTNLVLSAGVSTIFVDGGFCNNPIFMNLLAAAYPNYKVYAATVAQATALGAALVLHPHWNSQPYPKNLVALKAYCV